MALFVSYNFTTKIKPNNGIYNHEYFNEGFMKTLKFSLSRMLLCSGMLTFVMSPAYADPACDAEVVAIQTGLDAPAAGISPDNLEQARHLLKVLIEDCDSGTPFETVAPVAQQIRTLLGMGEAS